MMEVMGWNQTETARHLHMTPSAVNHIINPNHPTRPSLTTIQLFKLLLARDKPDSINVRTMQIKEEAIGAEERNIIEELRQLPRNERERVLAVMRTMIRTAADAAGDERPVQYKIPRRKAG
jgi:hypothetical protein